MPLTPIGKIFKPALRLNAIQFIYKKELDALGDLLSSVDVTVRDDKLHGSFAEISVTIAQGVSKEEAEEKVKEVLARYTIKYDLELS